MKPKFFQRGNWSGLTAKGIVRLWLTDDPNTSFQIDEKELNAFFGIVRDITVYVQKENYSGESIRRKNIV